LSLDFIGTQSNYWIFGLQFLAVLLIIKIEIQVDHIVVSIHIDHTTIATRYTRLTLFRIMNILFQLCSLRI